MKSFVQWGSMLLLASVVRFTGLDYSVPLHFHIDEQLLLTSTVDLASDPVSASREKYFFNYGSVPRLAPAVPLAIAESARKLNINSYKQLRIFYPLARAQSALFGVATVLLVWFMGNRFLGPGVGFAAAWMLCFSPLHLRDSHFFTPDIMLTAFLTGTLFMALYSAEKSSRLAALVTGLVAGLAVGTKVSALAALAPILLSAYAVRSRSLVFHVLAGLLMGTVLGYWPVIFAPHEFAASMKTLATWASGDVIRQPDLQFIGTAPWSFWVSNLLYYGAGPIFLFIGICGLMVMRRFARASVTYMILAMGIPYFLLMGASFQKFMRFSLPLHPVLALGAGVCIVVAWRMNRLTRTVAVLALLIHALYGSAYAAIFLRTDPRIAAGRYLKTTLPRGSTILLETTHSNPPLISDDFRKGLYGSYLPKLGECVVERSGRFTLRYVDPYRYLYDTAKTSGERAACLMEALTPADIVVIGPRYRDQYLRLADQFPAMARFYRGLESGGFGFQRVRSFENPAHIGPVRIPDAASELTFRLFDRPYLLIYARRGSEAWKALCENDS